MAAIMYFRRDLRGSDHPALAAAALVARATQTPLCAFAWVPPDFISRGRVLLSAAQRGYLQALIELHELCAGKLFISSEDPKTLLPALARTLAPGGSATIHVSDSAPHERAELIELGQALAEGGYPLLSLGTSYAVAPRAHAHRACAGGQGARASTFNQYSPAWLAHGWPQPEPLQLSAGVVKLPRPDAGIIASLPDALAQICRREYRPWLRQHATPPPPLDAAAAQFAPAMVELPPIQVPLIAPPTELAGRGLGIETLKELVEQSAQTPPPACGALSARARWQEFCNSGLLTYAQSREGLATAATSQLSQALALGAIHPRTLLADLKRLRAQAAQSLPATQHAQLNASIDAFMLRLAERDFAADYLLNHPRAAWENADPQFPTDLWDEDRQLFAAWSEGRTGYPLIDAAMRQLHTTGWMPHRARVLVASFLTKDLLLPWQWGAQYFLEQLADADFAANQVNWQLVAGTAPGAPAFTRILNPLTQAERLDPDGAYVQRWLPEFFGDWPLFADAAAKPVRTRARARQRAVRALHRATPRPAGYPEPLVVHEEARKRSLERFRACKARCS